MLIDTHVHHWDCNALTYPWLDQEVSLPRVADGVDYAPPAIRRGTREAVIVEANPRPDQSREELAWILGRERHGVEIAGVVAQLAIDSDHWLEDLAHFAATPAVRGIRWNLESMPAGYCRSIARALRRAGSEGLTFDLCVRADQLVEIRKVVAATPGTNMVLDHAGAPPERNSPERPRWERAIQNLSIHPNVACKVSGPASFGSGDPRDWTEVVRHIVGTFGTKRVLFGSDWPVSTTSDTDTLLKILRDELKSRGCQSPDRRLSSNARAWYRLV